MALAPSSRISAKSRRTSAGRGNCVPSSAGRERPVGHAPEDRISRRRGRRTCRARRSARSPRPSAMSAPSPRSPSRRPFSRFPARPRLRLRIPVDQGAVARNDGRIKLGAGGEGPARRCSRRDTPTPFVPARAADLDRPRAARVSEGGREDPCSASIWIPSFSTARWSDGVLRVVINRPERRNACTIEMYHGIKKAAVLADRGRRASTRLLLTGIGDVFCVGGEMGGQHEGGAALDRETDGLDLLPVPPARDAPARSSSPPSTASARAAGSTWCCAATSASPPTAPPSAPRSCCAASPTRSCPPACRRASALALAEVPALHRGGDRRRRGRRIGLVARVVPHDDLPAAVERVLEQIRATGPAARAAVKQRHEPPPASASTWRCSAARCARPRWPKASRRSSRSARRTGRARKVSDCGTAGAVWPERRARPRRGRPSSAAARRDPARGACPARG